MNAAEPDSARLSRNTLIAYFVTLALFTAGAFLPHGRVWGFNWWSYFPLWVSLVLLACGLMAPLIVRLIPQSVFDISEARPGRFWLVSSGGVVICLILFWIGRNETHFLGDGYQVLSYLQNHLSIHLNWNLPVVWMQNQVYRFTGGETEAQALLALRMISILSGLGVILTLLWTGRRLGLSIVKTWLVVLGVITSGVGLLFFGYVETYPPFIFAVTLTCALGVLVAENKLSRWWLVPSLAAAIAFHLFAVTLIPAVAYLVLRPTALWVQLQNKPRALRYGLALIAIVAGGVTIAMAARASYQVRFMIVPPVADRFTVDGYTMFSLAHLADLANLLFLLLPALLVLLVIFRKHWSTIFGQTSARFLGLSSLGCLALVCVVDPKLGMLRDWDLFAFAGIPLALGGYLALVDARTKIHYGVSAALLAIVLGLCVLIPRVMVTASEERSLNLVNQMGELDRAKSKNLYFVLRDYFKRLGDSVRVDSIEADMTNRYSELTLHERALGKQKEGKIFEAIALDSQALAINPMYYDPYSSLFSSYVALGRIDEALEMCEIEFGLNPRNAAVAYNLANVQARLGRIDQSQRYLKRALDLDSTYVPAMVGMGLIAISRGNLDELRHWLNKIASAKEPPPSAFYDMIQAACANRRYDYATEIVALGRQHGLDSAAVAGLVRDYPQLGPLLH